MDRWYYDDPLAAAWMAKHHGMRVTNRNGMEMFNLGITLASKAGPDIGRVVHHKDRDPIYIHPDSLPLLELREGDVYLNTAGQSEIWHIGFPWLKSYRIIQRDGKGFHWPKQETPHS